MTRKRHPKKAREPATAPTVDAVDAVVAELRAIELSFSPSGSDAPRLRAQLDDWREREADEDLQFEIPEAFGRVLFARLCERYGVATRRHANDPLTIYAKLPPSFAEEILWPQYAAMGAVIARFVHGHVSNVIAAWLHPAG